VSHEDDIFKVRKEEEGRGRRPQHLSEKERRQHLRSTMMIAIRRGNRNLFQQALIELGQKPGSSEYENSMKMYEAYQRENQ